MLSKGLLGWSNEIHYVKKKKTRRVSVRHVIELASIHLQPSQHEVMLEGWEPQGTESTEGEAERIGQGREGPSAQSLGESPGFVPLPLF